MINRFWVAQVLGILFFGQEVLKIALLGPIVATRILCIAHHKCQYIIFIEPLQAIYSDLTLRSYPD